MEEKQIDEILYHLKQISRGFTGRSTSFEYLDFQIDSLRELIQETAEIANKELGS